MCVSISREEKREINVLDLFQVKAKAVLCATEAAGKGSKRGERARLGRLTDGRATHTPKRGKRHALACLLACLLALSLWSQEVRCPPESQETVTYSDDGAKMAAQYAGPSPGQVALWSGDRPSD